ncbi:unnamed protein product [Polarella glacialis]|uniref:EF-hand domain-containing protein n=1 Tax=Polarella glacialis TaxID=89957 RepID=A0A813JQY9_POLGL|nr:unnamed protein product [Polarella glacialis]
MESSLPPGSLLDCLNFESFRGPDAAAAPTTQLLDEVDKLMHHHRIEIEAYLLEWCQRHESKIGPTPLPELREESSSKCSACSRLVEATRIGKISVAASECGKDEDKGLQAELQPLSPNSCASNAVRVLPSPGSPPPQPPPPPPKKNTKTQSGMLARSQAAKPGKSRKSEMMSDAKRLELLAQQTMVQKITASRQWEWFSISLILFNTIYIGLSTQYIAQRAESAALANQAFTTAEPEAFFVCQVLFTILFTFELSMRWVSDGLIEFWKGDDICWNALDLCVVLFGFVDLALTLAQRDQNGGSFTVIRVIRVVRVVRVARIIRVMKFFRELRLMLLSIMSSFKNLTWVVVVLGMLFYVFAITFTSAATDFLETTEMRSDPANKELVDTFGTLDKSVLSLYMCMSGGSEWSTCYNSLHVLPWLYCGLFLSFITFALFAVVNIVTGVFVESAMQSSLSDRESIVQDEISAQRSYLQAMGTLFLELDEDQSGLITLEEFQGRMDDPRVVAYFNSLKLDVTDASMLFRLLDEDGSGEVTCEEFVTGCQKLQGESRSLDAKIMQLEVKSLKRSMDTLMKIMQSKPETWYSV